MNKKVEQLQAENARLREAIEDALPTLKSEEKHSSLITRTLQEAIASTDSSNWLQEQKAQWRREVAQIIRRYGIDWQMAEEEILRMAAEKRHSPSD